MSIGHTHLHHLPGHARLFVGLVTTLMVLIGLWAAWIYTIEKGTVDPESLPAYLSEEQRKTLQTETVDRRQESGGESRTPNLRENLGLAHVHINGQTLLFFALGALFLFTSVPARRKKLVFITFSAAILLHAVGLSGEGYHWLFDDILALSGVVMLVTMLYMALQIYADLGRAPKQGQAA